MALIQAGYGIPTDGNNPTTRAAPVGDTIEIRRIKGHRGQVAGVMVRASARFCAAYKNALKHRNWERLSATRLFSGTPTTLKKRP